MNFIVRTVNSFFPKSALAMPFILVAGCSGIALEEYGTEVSDPLELSTGNLISGVKGAFPLFVDYVVSGIFESGALLGGFAAKRES